MRNVVKLICVGILVLLLASCASTAPIGKSKVKCPSCGHEFELPVKGGR